MAISDILQSSEALFGRIAPAINELVVAIVIVLFGFVIGKILENVLRFLSARYRLDERLAKTFGAQRNYSRAIRRSVVRIIYLVAIIIALDRVALLRPVWLALLGLALCVVIVSLVLAGIEVVPNLFGRAAVAEKRLHVGDEITLYDQTGVIQGAIADVTLVDVRIRRKNGDLFIIPTATFLRERVVKRH
jgi:small-conductance mechanosensitive channel